MMITNVCGCMDVVKIDRSYNEKIKIMINPFGQTSTSSFITFIDQTKNKKSNQRLCYTSINELVMVKRCKGINISLLGKTTR